MKTTKRPNYGVFRVPQPKSRLQQLVERDPFAVGLLTGVILTIIPTVIVLILVNS